jgi:hypothetical protein
MGHAAPAAHQDAVPAQGANTLDFRAIIWPPVQSPAAHCCDIFATLQPVEKMLTLP